MGTTEKEKYKYQPKRVLAPVEFTLVDPYSAEPAVFIQETATTVFLKTPEGRVVNSPIQHVKKGVEKAVNAGRGFLQENG